VYGRKWGEKNNGNSPLTSALLTLFSPKTASKKQVCGVRIGGVKKCKYQRKHQGNGAQRRKCGSFIRAFFFSTLYYYITSFFAACGRGLTPHD